MRIPSLAKTLRAEIRRLAAREVDRALRPLRRLQRQMKSLKTNSTKSRRGFARFERKLARLQTRRAPGAVPGRPGRKVAVAGPDILALRKRLGMTRAQFAKLLDVSPGSIFGWESGRTTPRGASVARLGEAKKLGVRKARARVQAAGGATSARGRKRGASRPKAKRARRTATRAVHGRPKRSRTRKAA